MPVKLPKKISRNSYPHRFQLRESKGEESEQVFICGSSPELGVFDTSKAIAMKKTGSVWTVDLRLCIGDHFYKYFKKHPVRGIIWEGETTRVIKESGAPRIVFAISSDRWQDGASIPPSPLPIQKPVSARVPSAKEEPVKEKIKTILISMSNEEKEKLTKKKEKKKKKKARYWENKKKALTIQYKANMVCFYCKKTGHPLSECPGLVLKQRNLKEKAERKARERKIRETRRNETSSDFSFNENISYSRKDQNASIYERKWKSIMRYKQYDIKKNKRQKTGGKENKDNTRKKAQYLSPRLFMAL